MTNPRKSRSESDGARALSRPRQKRPSGELSRTKARVAELERELEYARAACAEAEHRSANTLQLAAAALLLKARGQQDGSRSTLATAAERLTALSVIQRELGQGGPGEIEPGPLLCKLCCALVAQEEGRISTKVDCIGRPLPAAITRAIGLIVNEAVTNAVKYAFPQDRAGEIFIQLRELPGGRLGLVVEDNGVGLRQDRVGSGSQFMALMAAQLGGELRRRTFDRNGVRLDLEFPERQA